MPQERHSSIKLRVENMDYDVVGGDFQKILAAVKSLPGRRFVSRQKLWIVPGSLEMTRRQLENSGFFLEGGAPAAETDTTQADLFNDRIKIEVAGFQAVATGKSFQDMLTVIKAISGRRFDGDSKRWNLPGTLAEIKARFEKNGLKLVDVSKPLETPASESEQPPAFAQTASSAPPPPSDMPSPMDDPGFGYEEGVDYDRFANDEPLFPPQDALPQDVSPPPPVETPSIPAKQSKGGGRRDQIKVRVGIKALAVVGGSFKEMLATVKDIPDRRFDGQSKQWLLPNDINSIQQHLHSKGFRLEEWQS